MLTLDQFSQSRLAVFIMEAGSGHPVRRLPVYAEVVLSPKVSSNFSAYRHPVLEDIAKTNAPVANLMERAARDRIAPEWTSANEDRYGEVLKLLYVRLDGLQGTDPPPPEAATRAREELEIIAREFRVPAPTPWTPPAERVIPLGMLATDHAGFVSFDLERVDVRGIPADESAARDLTVDFRVFPGLLEDRGSSVIAQNRIAPDAVVARIEWNHA